MALVRVQVLDASGGPVTVNVQISGCDELVTNAQGLTQFLIDESDPKEVLINGSSVWSGPSSALKPMEVFKAAGASYERQ